MKKSQIFTQLMILRLNIGEEKTITRVVLPAQKYLDKVVVCRRARELGVNRKALKMRLGLYLSECSLA